MVSKHYHAEGRTKVVSNFSELAPEAALEEETRVGVQLNETVMELVSLVRLSPSPCGTQKYTL